MPIFDTFNSGMQSNTNQGNLPNDSQTPTVLWLASWYPCRIDRFNGDFIQRAARAVATRTPVHVFYLMKDENGLVTKNHREETHQEGNLKETRLYYHPLKTGLNPFDRLISAYQYTRLGRKWLRQWKASLPEKQPVIVEVAVAMRAGTLALWMKKKWGLRFVVKEHWTGYYQHLVAKEMQQGPLFWKMTENILSKADALLCDSRHLGEWINSHYLNIPFFEIPNVVDTRHFFYEEKTKSQQRVFHFIHVSTLGYQKNPEGILRAFEDYIRQSQNQRVSLSFIGPNFQSLQSLVNKNPNLKDKVIFHGEIPYTEVAAKMREADALILFSRHENLPCVMLEAFCCGLPVIATRVGGIAYHLHPSRGIVIDSEDETQLEQAIGKIILQHKNYDRGQISTQAMAQYSISTIANQYLETYNKIYPHLLLKNAE
jgi:glycosyltransferase involved in cell wall biosynthesis